MPISLEQIRKVKTPFFVMADCIKGSRKGLPRKGQRPVKCIGFSENDPLGVGGGIFPDFPCVYFEGGGWLLLKDLMRYNTIVKTPKE